MIKIQPATSDTAEQSMNDIRGPVFPPTPDHEHEWAALGGMLACVVNGREAEYVSTPLTTGLRFIDWYRTEGHTLPAGSEVYRQAHQERVKAFYSLHAQHFIEHLRTERRIVIEPTSLIIPHWTQNDYRHLWGQIIQRYARRVWLIDGWQYSSGCAFEFYVACLNGIETLSETKVYISRKQGVRMIAAAIAEIESLGLSADFLKTVVKAISDIRHVEMEILPKDETLDRLAASHNVAQFVSFGPGDQPAQRYCHIMGVPIDHRFATVEEAIQEQLNNASDGTVNVRSFRPGDDTSYPFEYGIRTPREAAALVLRLASAGLNTIVNETIDIHDGGISGVLAANLVEFAPDDTPRCVEKPGTARLPLDIAEVILKTVYGIRPEWDREPTRRVEFSIHPQKRGVRHDHTIIWEIGSVDDTWSAPTSPGRLQIGGWPNRFSRLLGDKTYGLLLAYALGFPVPRTTVFSSRLAPFIFGRPTGKPSGCWLRTAPAENEPGRYPTCFIRDQDFAVFTGEFEAPLIHHGDVRCLPLLEWTAVTVLQQHGFTLRRSWETTDGDTIDIPSVLAQQSVASEWSGSLITQQTGPSIMGVRGFADRFMMGEQKEECLPQHVCRAVTQIQQRLEELIGPISMEWAYDGKTLWVLQLHQELSPGSGNIIVPGDANEWHRFEVSRGLVALRELATLAARCSHGIEFTESVAATSHAAAIVRKAMVPARVASASS